MSGTGHNVTYNITQTGNQGIDGVLSGRAWTDSTIYYSFPTSSSEYGAGYYQGEPNTFSTISSYQQTAAHFALNADIGPAASKGFSVEGFTNLTITYTTAAGAHIRYADSTAPSTAWAYSPGTYQEAGDVWFGQNYNYDYAVAGNYAWHTLLHETGHALGLKHGHDTSGFGAIPSNLDAMEYSVMTYRSYINGPTTGYTNETWGFAQTYMMLDIAALQHMYGADFTTNSGNTVYSWDPSTGRTYVNGQVGIDPGDNRIFATIWDGGGIDTYDLSAYSTDLQINLQPGQYSLFSNVQRAYLGNGNYAHGNIYNALLYQGDTRSLIENAIGGSGNDTIHGNVTTNRLEGGAGNDALYGYEGADVLIGGTGNDTLYATDATQSGDGALNGPGGFNDLWGGAGDDILYGSAGVDRLVGGTGADRFYAGDGDDWIYADGNDTIINGGSGFDRLFVTASSTYSLNVTAAQVEVVFGGDENDVFDASGANYTVYLIGARGNDTLTGGNAVDVLLGYDDQDVLNGGGSTDWLYGGKGSDRLNGGAGDDFLIGGDGTGADGAIDFYEFSDNWGTDRIYEFDDGIDIIDMTQVSGLNSFSQLTITDVTGGAAITYGGSPGSVIYVIGITASQLTAADFWL